MDQILQQLEQAARAGQRAIENGDWARDQLPDAEFAKIVPPSLEDAVIDAMRKSGHWRRSSEGFNLKDWHS